MSWVLLLQVPETLRHVPNGWVHSHTIFIKILTTPSYCFSQSKMKVLFSTAVFAVAAIGGVLGQFGPNLERQACATAVDALYAVGYAVDGCGVPDMVIVMSLRVL